MTAGLRRRSLAHRHADEQGIGPHLDEPSVRQGGKEELNLEGLLAMGHGDLERPYSGLGGMPGMGQGESAAQGGEAEDYGSHEMTPAIGLTTSLVRRPPGSAATSIAFEVARDRAIGQTSGVNGSQSV
jgi:hypothetical protein